MSTDTRAGFGLVEFLVVVIVVVALVIVVTAIRRPNANQGTANNLAAQIAPIATIGTPYTSSLTAAGAANASMTSNAAWLSYRLWTLSGTPDGNEFGTFNVTISYGDGDEAETATGTIEVAAPTLGSAPELVCPYRASGSTDVVISPAPKVSYTGTVTYVLTSQGPTGLELNPTSFTTNNSGEIELSLDWQSGSDFTADIFLHLTSPSTGQQITLGPIRARSE